jgi:hypothetical protein
MRENYTAKAQFPRAAPGTGDTDDYANFTAVLCERSSDLMGIWLYNADQARAEAGFHRECIDQWRRTLGQIGWELKRGAAVDISSKPKATDLSELRETHLEMARRHVREGEAIVTRQRKITAGMPSTGEPSRAARRLLVEFERTLCDHKAHLARLEKRGAA